MQSINKNILWSVCIGLFLTVVYAEAPLSKDAEKYLEETRRVTGDNTETAAKGKLTNDKVGGRFDNFMDTVIWNDTFSKKTDKVPQIQLIATGVNAIPLDSPVDKANGKWKREEKRLEALRAADANRSKEIPTFYAGGYCTFDTTLSISKSNEYGKLDCLLDFGQGGYKKVEVFASFYPDYKREIVIALPIYITLADKTRATLSGVVLNADKTSVNLAGWVDNKRIQKMLGEGMLSTNDIVFNYVSGYMRALTRSRTHTGVEYVTTTDPNTGNTISTPIATTNVEKPEVKDYVISAGVEIVSTIFSVIGKDYLNSKYPLFAVYPQKMYVEGVVSFDNQGLAKRFGNISAEIENKSKQNNGDWLKERNDIVNKYDRRYNNSGIVGEGQ